MNRMLRILRLLLLGLWLGAAIFFGAAVAPALFDVLRAAQLPNANELAGTIVTRLLAIINRGGFEISLFLIVTGYFMTRNESRLARFAEMISLAILAIMTGISHWVISARMLALRAAKRKSLRSISLGISRKVKSPSGALTSKGSVPSMYAPAEEISARFNIDNARRAGAKGARVFSTKG